jgi:hypothetical protein
LNHVSAQHEGHRIFTEEQLVCVIPGISDGMCLLVEWQSARHGEHVVDQDPVLLSGPGIGVLGEGGGHPG